MSLSSARAVLAALAAAVFLAVMPPAVRADTVWVDDAVPIGARLFGDAEGWTWSGTGPAPVSGSSAHRSALVQGMHQHYFLWASATMRVEAGATLFAYVYLDPVSPPRQVMLQWNDGLWEHRAYWGENLLPWGADGTASRRYMGPLPQTARWVRLEVPAASVGLEGSTVNGMAFTLYGGRATWDAAGVRNRPSWVDDALPAGAAAAGPWTWVTSSPTPFSGTRAHTNGPASGAAQHYFYGAPATQSVAPGAVLFAHVFLDPQSPPREIMLQWNDGLWEHRAFWGEDLIPWGAPGTAGRRAMGALPPTGRWVRLEVPAALVGLEGRAINGLAFTAYDGLVFWDAAGVRNPTDPPFAQAFTTAQAFSQVVSSAPSQNVAGATDGFDANGRIVWSTGPHGTYGYRYDAAGNVVETVDAFGNRITGRYDASGRLDEVLHRFNYGGTWSERYGFDAASEKIVEEASTGPNRLLERLWNLGLQPGAPLSGATVQEWESAGWRHTIRENAFAVAYEQVLDPAVLPGPDGVYHREVTVIRTGTMSKRMEVKLQRVAGAIRVSDEWGGWRHERYDGLGRLSSVSDAAGIVLSIERDPQGRPTRVYLGETGLLEYTYDAQGWVTKRLTDRPSGDVIYEGWAQIRGGEFFERFQDVKSQPRPIARAYLPGHGPVIEWDETFSPNGSLVASLFGMPYALLQLDHSEPIWRSITPELGRFCQERIDYTDDEIVLHLERDAGGQSSARHTTAFRFGRASFGSFATAAASADEELEEPADGAGWTIDPLSAAGGLESITAALNVQHCGSPNVGCWCIERKLPAGLFIEIRCPEPQGNPDPPVLSPGPVPQPPRPPGVGLSGTRLIEVNRARSAATTRLRDSQSCRDLFKDLDRPDGTEVLLDTIYRNGDNVRDAQGNVPCAGSAAAWTHVGSPVVMICRSFSDLTTSERTVKIIHEALHSAGQRESPGYPGSPTSAELDQRVRDACGL